MKKHKTLIAFIILVLLLGVFLAVTLYSSILSYMDASSGLDLTASGMIDTLDRLQDHIASLGENYRVKTENSLELMCTALGPMVRDGAYDGPEVFKDGVVVRIEDGKIVYPESFPGRFDILTEAANLEQLENMTGAELRLDPENNLSVLISAGQIKGDYWYIDWWDMEEYRSSINFETSIGDAVSTFERLYDASLLVVREEDDETTILYASAALNSPGSIEDLGLTNEDLASQSSSLKIGKKLYTAAYTDLIILDRPAEAIVLVDPISSHSYAINCVIIATGYILLCMAGYILWIHWIGTYSRDHELTEDQKKAWQPERLRRVTIPIGVNGAILLFAILIGYHLLGNLSHISKSNQQSLDVLMARLENSSKWIASARTEEEEWGIYFAGRIADLYSSSPEIFTVEFLQKVNELTGSEYIMLFDADGKEILASNGYTGFTIGDGVNTGEDFSYLLNGIDHIVSEPEIDKFSGNIQQVLGVKMDLGKKDSYGAVVLAIDPETTWRSAETQDIGQYVGILTHPENLCFVVSRDSGKVVYSSEPELLDRESREIGLDMTDMTSTSLDTFEILGVKRYGAFGEDEQYRAFFMTNADEIWGDSVKFSLFAALSYLLISLVISLFLLGPAHVNILADAEREKEAMKQLPDLKAKKTLSEPSAPDEKEKRSLKEWWHDMTPEQRVTQLTKITLTLILVELLGVILDTDKFGGKSVTSFIMNGDWKRGMNELAITAIICVLIILFAFILIKGLLVRLLNSMLNAKGRTIVGLISSLLQYIAIISAIFVCLAYLGIDTSVLITSASVLTLAISLGSKDLVADILAGIFIIFEGDFRVGDTIEVSGFKGKVLDIGVRSTKLIDSSQNVKIIDNQSVKNVLNLSMKKTWIFIPLTISTAQPLEEIEAMLDRELPEIAKTIPTITGGPAYWGIDEIGYHRLRIGFGAECEQENSSRTKAELNHALWNMFTKNGIQL